MTCFSSWEARNSWRKDCSRSARKRYYGHSLCSEESPPISCLKSRKRENNYLGVPFPWKSSRCQATLSRLRRCMYSGSPGSTDITHLVKKMGLGGELLPKTLGVNKK